MSTILLVWAGFTLLVMVLIFGPFLLITLFLALFSLGGLFIPFRHKDRP